MNTKPNIEEWMQVKPIRLDAIRTIGFRGNGPEDEKKLFEALKARRQEIRHRLDEYDYLVIAPNGLYVTAAVSAVEAIPEGMESITLPSDAYQVFRFEERYIGEFWDHFCSPSNQAKYELNVNKIRFEIFKPELQPQGVTEIYFPTNG